jgi:hypothetical protein
MDVFAREVVICGGGSGSGRAGSEQTDSVQQAPLME